MTKKVNFGLVIIRICIDNLKMAVLNIIHLKFIHQKTIIKIFKSFIKNFAVVSIIIFFDYNNSIANTKVRTKTHKGVLITHTEFMNLNFEQRRYYLKSVQKILQKFDKFDLKKSALFFGMLNILSFAQDTDYEFVSDSYLANKRLFDFFDTYASSNNEKEKQQKIQNLFKELEREIELDKSSENSKLGLLVQERSGDFKEKFILFYNSAGKKLSPTEFDEKYKQLKLDINKEIVKLGSNKEILAKALKSDLESLRIMIDVAGEPPPLNHSEKRIKNATEKILLEHEQNYNLPTVLNPQTSGIEGKNQQRDFDSKYHINPDNKISSKLVNAENTFTDDNLPKVYDSILTQDQVLQQSKIENLKFRCIYAGNIIKGEECIAPSEISFGRITYSCNGDKNIICNPLVYGLDAPETICNTNQIENLSNLKPICISKSSKASLNCSNAAANISNNCSNVLMAMNYITEWEKFNDDFTSICISYAEMEKAPSRYAASLLSNPFNDLASTCKIVKKDLLKLNQNIANYNVQKTAPKNSYQGAQSQPSTNQ